MKGKGTIIFVIIAIVITVAAILYFLFKKPSGAGTIGGVKKGGGTKNASGGGGAGYTYTNTDIGKDAYASNDGVNVYNSDLSLYKTAAADEWVGKVSSTKAVHIPGTFDSNSNTWSSGLDIQAYVVSGGKLVNVNDVYLN